MGDILDLWHPAVPAWGPVQQAVIDPEGDFQAKTKAVLKLPKGEFYTKVETARGELGVYIVSEGGTTPYRIKFRSPGFSNLSVLEHIARGSKIGDLVAMMGTLDLVIPDIDR